jgi:hypothetical protein
MLKRHVASAFCHRAADYLDMPQLKQECLQQLACSDVALRCAQVAGRLGSGLRSPCLLPAACYVASRAPANTAPALSQPQAPTGKEFAHHRHAQLVLELAQQLRLPELQPLEARALAGLQRQLSAGPSGDVLCKVRWDGACPWRGPPALRLDAAQSRDARPAPVST